MRIRNHGYDTIRHGSHGKSNVRRLCRADANTGVKFPRLKFARREVHFHQLTVYVFSRVGQIYSTTLATRLFTGVVNHVSERGVDCI